MNAYLIDPFAQTVTQVEYSGDYQHIYKLIDADTFDVVYFNRKNDGVFVDDEGLFKPEQAFFKIAGIPNPLAGKALVLGCDDEGDSVAPSASFEDVQSLVSFGEVVALPGGKAAWLEAIE